jgi:signal transduction histidine kinase/DNA-binding response OmpR family regulator
LARPEAASDTRPFPPIEGLTERPKAAELLSPPVAAPRRIAAGFLAAAAAGGVLVAGAAALAWPVAAPFVAPLIVLAGGAALWGASRADSRRLAADLDRLAADNRRLAEMVERLADAAWVLHESDERYRTLADARRRAEAASEAKSRVLATVSHEFRTPLNGILGLTGLLLETPLTPDQATHARGVHSSGEALLALVDDMLDFSRIEAGRLDLRPASTDLEALLQEIVELLAARAHAKGIDIAAEIGPGVPVAVAVDAARLRQVLINLAGNGVKFTDSGGVTVSVAVADGGIAFSVADSGPGIAPDETERLFGEFEQSDSALSRRHGGAGLGLAISRQIVRAMGGDIAVAPGESGGSVFRFALALPSAPAVAGHAPPDLAGRKVLLVAPEGAEPPALARQLADCGAAVRIAASANEAAGLIGAATAAGEPHDALIVDARVPPEAGAALARIREAAGRRVPAAVMLEPGRRGDVDALRQAGFDAYLVRPVRRSSLFRIVGEIVSGGGAFRAEPGDDAQSRRTAPPRRAATHVDVLLAEDNEINALLARAVLEGLGHTVTEVRDGVSAVAAAAERRFGAILMDLHMPGLDGLAAVRAIRDRERRDGGARSAILAVTADVLAGTRAEALAAGVDAVVEKPMTPDALRRALAEIAGRDAA